MENIFLINSRQFYIYGASVYIMCPYLHVIYVLVAVKPEQLYVNTTMSSVCASVGRTYTDVKQYWTINDLSRITKVPQANI